MSLNKVQTQILFLAILIVDFKLGDYTVVTLIRETGNLSAARKPGTIDYSGGHVTSVQFIPSSSDLKTF